MTTWASAVKHALRAFFVWWASELAALLPSALGRALARRDDELVFRAAGERVELCRRSANTLETLAVIAGDEAEHAAATVGPVVATRRNRRLPVTAVLSRDQYLTPRLTLPLAAAEAPREAVRYQVNRISPFRAEDVYFDARVLGRNALEKTIDVEAVLVPRRAVEDTHQRASACGLAIDRIALADPSGDPAAFRVFDAASAKPRATASKAIHATLAAALLLLVGASILWPQWQRQRLADGLKAEIAAVKPKAEKAAALRREVEGAASLGTRVADARRRTPLAISVVTRVSDLLPDDVWLTEYRIEKGQVTISGSAPDATALLPLIENADEFEAAKFSAATSRDPALGRDRFSLSFAVAARK